VRLKGYVLAPPGGLAGRFDLVDEATAYVADSPETALYESLFRREVRSCHLSRIEQRTLVSFETVAPVRLVDLRGLEERYPVPQPRSQQWRFAPLARSARCAPRCGPACPVFHLASHRAAHGPRGLGPLGLRAV